MKTLTHSQNAKFAKSSKSETFRIRDRREGKRAEKRQSRANAIREAMRG